MIESAPADIYSLGLVLLELCTLEVNQNYLCANSSTNDFLIQDLILKASQSYSKHLIETINRMIVKDSKARINL